MKEAPQRILFDISWEALLKIVVLCLGLWAAYILRDILIMLFVVFIFVAALNPTIQRLQQYMSRTLAVTLVYVILFVIIFLLSYVFIPLLIGQLNDLNRNLPTIMSRVKPFIKSLFVEQNPQFTEQALNSLVTTLNQIPTTILQTSATFFNGLVFTITGAVLAFHLLLEEKNAKDFFHQLFPQHRFEAVYSTVSKISDRMGGWVRGQLLLMLIIAAANFLAYILVGLPTPLPLAIWAGLCEVIPLIGPLIGVIPALVVALTTGSILQALLVLVFGYILIQQLEAHLIVPKVMGRVLGLSPVLVILSLVIGARLFGLVGAIVAIPTAAIVSVVIREWPQLRKIWEG